jgi:hypothetical protein
MRTSRLRATAVAVSCILLHTAAVVAGGVTFGVPIATVDLGGAIDRLPMVADGALTAVEPTLIDLGFSQADLAEVRERIDESIEQIEDLASTLPPLVPLPMVGGAIEIALPLIVVDGIRLSGGWLNEGLLHGLLGVAGVELPEPLFDGTFDWDGGSATATIDAAFSAWMLSTDLVKRFDLIVLALSFGGGVDLIGGAIRPEINLDVPVAYREAVDGALAALHLDELTWSTFAVHGVVGFEIGPPFLRLYGDLRFLLPLSEEGGWWNLRAGGVAAVLGLVIRF